MTRRDLPEISYLRECFRVDHDTGTLYWRERPEHHFADATVAFHWNARHAGNAVYAWTDRNGYAYVEMYPGGKKVRWPCHRIVHAVVTGEDPERVDHRDGDVSNNRPSNLRGATILQNRWNSPGERKYPFPKGVVRSGKRFYAKGKVPQGGGKSVHLGTFDTPGEAHAAWRAWAQPLHGDFFNPGPEKITIFD